MPDAAVAAQTPGWAASGFRSVRFPQLSQQHAGKEDPQTGNAQVVEMPVTRYERVNLALHGKCHQVIVIGIPRNNPRRIDRVGEPDRLLLDTPAQVVDLARRDPVAPGNPRSKERLPHLFDQLSTSNQFEVASSPEVKQTGRSAACRDRARNDAVRIDNDLQRFSPDVALPSLPFASRLVDSLMSECVGGLLAQVCLGSDPIEDAETFSESSFENLRVAAPGPRRTNADLAHQPLIDRERGLHFCHISILPYPNAERLPHWNVRAGGSRVR